MPIRLRNKTQTRRLPRADAFGVGTPANDGGAGAFAAGLDRAASELRSFGRFRRDEERKAERKEENIETARANNTLTEASARVSRLKASFEQAQQNGDTKEMERIRSEIGEIASPDVSLNRFLPEDADKFDPEIESRFLPQLRRQALSAGIEADSLLRAQKFDQVVNDGLRPMVTALNEGVANGDLGPGRILSIKEGLENFMDQDLFREAGGDRREFLEQRVSGILESAVSNLRGSFADDPDPASINGKVEAARSLVRETSPENPSDGFVQTRGRLLQRLDFVRNEALGTDEGVSDRLATLEDRLEVREQSGEIREANISGSNTARILQTLDNIGEIARDPERKKRIRSLRRRAEMVDALEDPETRIEMFRSELRNGTGVVIGDRGNLTDADKRAVEKVRRREFEDFRKARESGDRIRILREIDPEFDSFFRANTDLSGSNPEQMAQAMNDVSRQIESSGAELRERLGEFGYSELFGSDEPVLRSQEVPFFRQFAEKLETQVIEDGGFRTFTENTLVPLYRAIQLLPDTGITSETGDTVSVDGVTDRFLSSDNPDERDLAAMLKVTDLANGDTQNPLLQGLMAVSVDEGGTPVTLGSEFENNPSFRKPLRLLESSLEKERGASLRIPALLAQTGDPELANVLSAARDGLIALTVRNNANGISEDPESFRRQIDRRFTDEIDILPLPGGADMVLDRDETRNIPAASGFLDRLFSNRESPQLIAKTASHLIREEISSKYDPDKFRSFRFRELTPSEEAESGPVRDKFREIREKIRRVFSGEDNLETLLNERDGSGKPFVRVNTRAISGDGEKNVVLNVIQPNGFYEPLQDGNGRIVHFPLANLLEGLSGENLRENFERFVRPGPAYRRAIPTGL